MAETGEMQRHPPEEPDESKIVTLSGRDLEDARRLLSLLSTPDGRRISIQAPSAGEWHVWESRERLVSKAREILHDRQLRVEKFGKSMFRETAWDILLTLYAGEGAQRQTISRLANLIGSSRTTALRWLDYLEQQHLIRREGHPTDRRTAFVELTDKGRERLDEYFSQVVDAVG